MKPGPAFKMACVEFQDVPFQKHLDIVEDQDIALRILWNHTCYTILYSHVHIELLDRDHKQEPQNTMRSCQQKTKANIPIASLFDWTSRGVISGMVWALGASLMARKPLRKTTRNMVVDQHPVLEGSLKRLGVPFRMDPIHDTFQAIDVHLPALRPQCLGTHRTFWVNIARHTVSQLHPDLGRDRDSMG